MIQLLSLLHSSVKSLRAAIILVACMINPVWADPSPFKIAFVGDSMIDGVWGGFARVVATNSCLKPLVKLGRYGENGVGLARADRHNWKATLQKINQEFQPDMILPLKNVPLV